MTLFVPYAHQMRLLGSDDVRPTRHLQVRGGPHGRVWYALWRDADGRHQRRLGPAHVRDSGRRTARGAVVWWAGNGPKPDASHLTPAEADQALQELLAEAARAPTDPRHKRAQDHTFAKACDAWLAYVAHEEDGRPSTLNAERVAVRRTGDFNVLAPEEVHAVARADRSALYGAV